MQAVLTTYLVIASLPVVVEDEVDEALSYAPGAVFQALSNNPSIVRLLENEQIIETYVSTPVVGSVVIQGPPGPTGSSAATGWEDVGSLVRLLDVTDQVSAGAASPPASVKVTIDASSGGYSTGLLVVSGAISSPGVGPNSERFGLGSLSGGDCSLALGNGADAAGTSSSAGGCAATATAGFGTAWGAFSLAGIDGTSLGAGSESDQGGTAVGRSSVSTGLRSFSGGLGATNMGADSTLLGANGDIGADQATGLGGNVSVSAEGGIAAGFGSSVSGIDASAWGRGASSAFWNSLAFGAWANTTASGQVVFGSQTNPLEFYYFGRGEAAIVKQDVRLASTRISTTQINEPGSNLILEAGPGTGDAPPSRIFLQTAPAGLSGSSQQVLATQMVVGEGVDVTNWLNVGPTVLADSVGDISATDGTTTFLWDATTPQLNLGLEGVVTMVRGIDATTSGVGGGSLYFVSGTGLTTGPGGVTRIAGGDGGVSGAGGLAALLGGAGVAGGGPVEVLGGDSAGAAGGLVTTRGGSGTPAGNLIATGGITNGVGGQSGDGIFGGGDASATLIALAGDGILKGGDGLSNNNHGGHVFVRGGVANGVGVHGRVQIETSGVGRWQVDNQGHLLGVADAAYDIGAAASGRPRDLFVARDVVIDGDLVVNGTQTIIDTELQTADNYILQNSEYTADIPQTAGIVNNVDPAATSFSIADITANVITVAAGDPSLVLAAGDFILIQNPATASNVGIYEVLSTTVSSITINTSPVEDFSGTGLTDDATAQGTVVGTRLGVFRSNTSGFLEEGTGTAAPIVFRRPGLQYVDALVDFSVSGVAVGLIPAGALPVSVTTRVLTTIGGAGVTGYEIGDTTDPNRWGSIPAVTAGTTSTPQNFTDNTLSFNASTSAADVVLTGIGGTPTSGTVRVELAYMDFLAPAS